VHSHRSNQLTSNNSYIVIFLSCICIYLQLFYTLIWQLLLINYDILLSLYPFNSYIKNIRSIIWSVKKITVHPIFLEKCRLSAILKMLHACTYKYGEDKLLQEIWVSKIVHCFIWILIHHYRKCINCLFFVLCVIVKTDAGRYHFV